MKTSPFPHTALHAAAALVLALLLGALGTATPADAYDPGLLRGGIGAHYRSTPAVQKLVGDPVAPQDCRHPRGACVQRFQRGVITAEPGVGIFVVRGGMYGYWAGHVQQTGFPVGNEAVDVSGVGVQRFRNETLVWSTATGTHPVRGAIRDAYVTAGGPANAGAPSGPEYAVTGGAAQDFLIPATGSRYTFTWHAATGRTFVVRGGIRTGWNLSRRIGAAVSAERGGLLRGGSYQTFTAGRAYWSPQTGGHTIRGAILGAWQRADHERGLGYPVTEERPVTGGVEQHFEHGIIRYAAATHAVTTVRTTPSAPEPSNTAAFDAEAARFKLGTPSGGKISVAGISARRYAHGTVYHSTTHGYVPAAANVAAVWERSPAVHGLPRTAAWTGGALSTRFEKDSLVFDSATRKVVRNDLTLGAGDALVIGDSQVADTSWVGKGIAANGYRLTVYRSGGIGYVADNQGNKYGSYGTGVLDNQWALPRGTPGMIFVGGSGNDRGASSAVITSRSTAVIRELQRLYPTSTIVMTGVISRSDVLYAERQRVEEALRVTARTTGARFIPLRGWIDTYNARGYMYDAYHFNEAGQVYMGSIFAPRLKEALARTP